MADERISVRLPDGMREVIRAARGTIGESEWIISALRGSLAAEPAAPVPAERSGIRLAGAAPSPGVTCSHSGCWQRNTARYGDPDDCGGLILCPAHAADAVGERYTRPHSPLPAAARNVHAGAEA
jgi:hypothetical protein